MDENRPTKEEIRKAIAEAMAERPYSAKREAQRMSEEDRKRERKKKRLKIASATLDLVTSAAAQGIANVEIVCAYEEPVEINEQDDAAPENDAVDVLTEDIKFCDTPDQKKKQ